MGTLVADGSEQTVFSSTETGEFSGYIDLSNMVTDDSVTCKCYIRIKSGGEYILETSETYNDAQTEPALHFPPRQSVYGYKVTLQQTAGTYREFDWVFFKR